MLITRRLKRRLFEISLFGFGVLFLIYLFIPNSGNYNSTDDKYIKSENLIPEQHPEDIKQSHENINPLKSIQDPPILEHHFVKQAEVAPTDKLLISTLNIIKNENNSIDQADNNSFIERPQLERIAAYPPAFLPSKVPPKENENSTGLGSSGNAVKMDISKLSPKEKVEYDSGWSKNSFNQFLSDRISVRRYIPDNRDSGCKNMIFDKKNFSMTSVIICFHNEAWTTLLRSVHSIIDRSPTNLIQEIILVDDASDFEHLKQPLDDYIAQLNGTVKIIRLSKRSGLIQARMRGAEIAQAPVLMFLDSHIECMDGWLEPLLQEIAINNKTVISPVITSIKDNTLELHSINLDSVQVGGFSWDLVFNWHFPPPRVVGREGAPYSAIPTPTIAGGLFAIHRDFFKELGWYDPKFEVWGAENLEISFKTWMCHGRLLISPCSQVGHIFRSHSPYKWNSEHQNPLGWNNARLAHAVLGDYKKYYLQYKPEREFGDVSERKAILEKLKCHDFKWFLTNIYPEKFDPSRAIFSGRIRNPSTDKCLDASNKADVVTSYPCHNLGGNQIFFQSDKNDIRRDDKCFDGNSVFPRLGFYNCHENKGAQEFIYSKTEKLIRNGANCVKILNDKKPELSINLVPCKVGDLSQEWIWE